MKSGHLPKAIAAGARRQERRKDGGAPRAPTAKSVIRSLIPVRPVMPAPGSQIASVDRSVKTPPAFKPARMTALNVVQAGRDKGRARASMASPREAIRSVGRQVRSAKRSKIASTTTLTRQNPPVPFADLNRGRLRYSGAFSSGIFRAPFQKSWNSRRSFGA